MPRHRDVRTLPFLALVVLVASAACGDDDDGTGDPVPAAEPDAVIEVDDDGDYAPDIAPDDFVEVVDNRYLPLLPGTRWVYEGEVDGDLERIEVEVLAERREVFGVQATVVRDRAFVDGELQEDTQDWYAQDGEGNVWYLGEETAEYDGGEVVSTEGSWEAGVDGALPGVVMLAGPRPGDAYRQEFYEGEAEDLAEVLRVGQPAAVAAGVFEDVVTIREWNPLEPAVVEEKHFAPGVGMISENEVAGGSARIDLVEVHQPGS
jgi:hypothetical protein